MQGEKPQRWWQRGGVQGQTEGWKDERFGELAAVLPPSDLGRRRASYRWVMWRWVGRGSCPAGLGQTPQSPQFIWVWWETGGHTTSLAVRSNLRPDWVLSTVLNPREPQRTWGRRGDPAAEPKAAHLVPSTAEAPEPRRSAWRVGWCG